MLESELGRNEIRVFSAPLTLDIGQSILDLALAARLQRRGYLRVRERPSRPGEFFWGNDVFWLFRRRHLWGRTRVPAQLLKIDLDRETGVIEHVTLSGDGEEGERPLRRTWIEPELFSESLTEQRLLRTLVSLDDMPEHLWRAVLAIEDARFFEHQGIDARGIARAAASNLKAGEIEQGGSTITQQLIKMRDLTPKRTLARKASEAVRALRLETEHSKEEILAAYLNSVYFGHVEGRSLYGVGTAAQTFFSKPVERLTLGEAATLAAIVQGPNRLSPVRNGDAVLKRQRLVLDRLQDLDWAPPEEIQRARQQGLPRLRLSSTKLAVSRQTLRWIADSARTITPRRLEDGRGVVVETTIDPYLQEVAETTLKSHLENLRSRQRGLRQRPLNAALVLLEGRTGRVLAHVGGDPSNLGDDFDRVRSARRQPGSAIKPLVILEALDDCGRHKDLNLATRVTDRPLTLDLPSGPWSPRNSDGEFRGVVDLREILVQSLNVPTVRVARHCGFDQVAGRFRRAGIELPKDPPPSFVLGAVEISPLQLAEAFTVFATPGDRMRASIIERVRQPSGESRGKRKSKSRRVSRASSAFLVRDALRETVESGTARGAALLSFEVIGKTGTTSDRRDAWFVGEAGGFVAAVWIGMDDGSRLGLTGSQAAVPLWRRFMERVVSTRSTIRVERPEGIVEHWIDPRSGRRLKAQRNGSEKELFRRRALPPRRRALVARGALEAID